MRERAVAYGYALLLNIWCNRGRQLRLINEDRSLDFLLGVWRESVSSWALKSQAKLTVPILQWCENTNWISQRVSLKGKTYQMACKPRRYQLHDGWLHGHPTWVFSAFLTVHIRHERSPRVACWPARLSLLICACARIQVQSFLRSYFSVKLNGCSEDNIAKVICMCTWTYGVCDCERFT